MIILFQWIWSPQRWSACLQILHDQWPEQLFDFQQMRCFTWKVNFCQVAFLRSYQYRSDPVSKLPIFKMIDSEVSNEKKIVTSQNNC